MSSHHIEIEKHPSKGILLCLLGYFFVSLIGVCEKAISPGVSITVILFFQNLICLLLSSPVILRKGWVTLKARDIRGYGIRIFSGLGCYAALFYLIRFMPISQAFLYQYSASLWIPFIMLIWMKVKMPKELWYGIVLGFAGIALILKPDASMLGMVSVIGLVCGVLQGISMVAIRKLSLVEPAFRILFYYFLVGTVVSGILMIKEETVFASGDAFWLLGVGLSTFMAQRFIAFSLRYASAATLAPICYSCILFSGLWGWVFWQELPDGMTLVGMSLVVLGCLLSFVMSKRNQRKMSEMAPLES